MGGPALVQLLRAGRRPQRLLRPRAGLYPPRPPSTFRRRRTLDLGDELRRELDARPWLLILDGLERVLVAYNRAGKEHMTDEEAVVARDDMGLDREPRDCFRPEDDDVLAMLAQAGRGKLLASSRLTPTR